MTMPHFDFSFFFSFNPGIFTTWGKNNNNNPCLLVADIRSNQISYTIHYQAATQVSTE